MTNNGYTDNKNDILKRLSRAEGQVRGISRLVAADTYCIDVITQIVAARAALDKVAVELIRDHASLCLQKNKQKSASSKAAADELAVAISRLL